MPSLLTPADKTWQQLWQQSIGREVFAHPAYAALFEDDKTLARAFFWEGKQGRIFYPFLLRNLQGEPFWRPERGEAYDMVTPYGYGGPVLAAGEPSQELFRDFYAALEIWALDTKVVSEFVRFSLFDEARKAYYGEVQHHNDNIVCDLSLSQEELWKGFRHKVRKNVTAASRHGITIEADPAGRRLSDFLRVYYHTIERHDASQAYFWPRSFFERMLATLTQHLMFFHALHEGRVVASELVLLSDTRIYSFLGGTFSDSFPMRPGDLLKYHIMQWAREQGYKQFVIGGGHRPHDGIFAFKQAFAPGGIYPFFVGKKVFNEDVYTKLVSRQQKGGFFPEYRAGTSEA